MPQKKVKLPGPGATHGQKTRVGTALANAKKRAKENAVKPPVKSLGDRLSAEKRAAAREANKAAKFAAQDELNKTREAHLDPHNTYHQIHNNINAITNDIVNADIHGNHADLVDHAHHLVTVLDTHGSALKVGTGRTSQSRGHVERVKSLLRDVAKNKEVSDHLRAKAKRIANVHLTHHVPDPQAPQAVKPSIVSRIRRVFEEDELHEDYGAGDVGTDEVVRKYKSMTPGEKKANITESYVLWLVENEQLDEASLHGNLKAFLHPEFHRAVKDYLHNQAIAGAQAAGGAIGAGIATGGHPLAAIAGGAMMLGSRAHHKAGKALLNAYEIHQKIANQHDTEKKGQQIAQKAIAGAKKDLGV